MNSFRAIGGFFGLELASGEPFHSEAIELNSARHAFEYILRLKKPRHVYVPKFICDAMYEPMMKLGIKYSSYSINQRLEIKDEINPSDGEMIVYINYFGLKSDYCRRIVKKFGENLVIDCSQAFYFLETKPAHSIYSARKFFGVSDGGYAYTSSSRRLDLEVDKSYRRMTHLLKRIDLGPEQAYKGYVSVESSFSDSDMKSMSTLTRKILGGIDYGGVALRRITNFNTLHSKLADKNNLKFDFCDNEAPLSYPFLSDKGVEIKKALISKRVYIPTYWPNVLKDSDSDSYEYTLSNKLVCLPVDQRYTEDDMKIMLDLLHEEIER